MRKSLKIALVASSMLIAVPAQAQQSEVEVLRAQVDALTEQLADLSARIAQMEDGAQQSHVASAPVTTPAPAVEASFAGAPEFEGAGGWSFKPFGRIQADAGFVSLPDGTGAGDGFGSELRRVRLGVSGDIPGGFGYKVEVDFAGNETEVTDAIITYADGGLTLTAGQHNTFQGLEELTSSRFSTFIERAAFTDAFGFERRLGLSAQYKSGPLLVQAGAFSDNIADLPGKAWSADGRVVFAPTVGENQLHLGGSVHLTEVEAGGPVRYRQRPLVHFTSDRPINTGNLGAESEFGGGLEAGLVSGPFHAAGEAFWQKVNSTGALPDPTFFGGYAEIGLYLTRGDSRGYKDFKFDRTRPASPIDEGGIGAVQINLRYDRLDLTDGAIVGGTQDGYFASLVWVPTDYTRLLLNYGHLRYSNAVLALPNGDDAYGANVFGVRGQLDF